MGMIVVLIPLVYLVSKRNVEYIGNFWVEAEHAGGMHLAMALIGAALSALGFSWLFAMLAGVFLASQRFLTIAELEQILRLGYLFFHTGLAFTIYCFAKASWANNYRINAKESMGEARQFTLAKIHNRYNAINDSRGAFNCLFNAFERRSRTRLSAKIAMVIFLCMVPFSLGILQAWSVICRNAGQGKPMTTPIDELKEQLIEADAAS